MFDVIWSDVQSYSVDLLWSQPWPQHSHMVKQFLHNDDRKSFRPSSDLAYFSVYGLHVDEQNYWPPIYQDYSKQLFSNNDYKWQQINQTINQISTVPISLVKQAQWHEQQRVLHFSELQLPKNVRDLAETVKSLIRSGNTQETLM